MTGLDLETFLSLPRIDPTAWVVLGLSCAGIAALVWWGWGSKRAIRKCLALSLVAHAGLAAYGATSPVLRWSLGLPVRDRNRDHLRQVRVQPVAAGWQGAPLQADPKTKNLISGTASRVERVEPDLALADEPLRTHEQPTQQALGADLLLKDLAAPAPDAPRIAPRNERASDPAAAPEPRKLLAVKELLTDRAPSPLDPDPTEREATVLDEPSTSNITVSENGIRDRSMLPGDRRLRVDHKRTARPRPGAAMLEPSVKQGSAGAKAGAGLGTGAAAEPVEIARVTPRANDVLDRLAADRLERRPAPMVPRMYQPRVEADRSAQAVRLGASAASERAVEAALVWLARHQDGDGRWDAGTARFSDGSTADGEDDYTSHCPVGDICSGECIYWEADTGITGLALLTYLGAGYTHRDGRYADAVRRGLEFLLRSQAADGDLRGTSRNVGMYCHAMATLALCEAYALSGDGRLRVAAERALGFLVRARARDGLAWRYAPAAPIGDTSILGWVVLCLKAANEIGIQIPNEASVKSGALRWLDQVRGGKAGGLGSYQPGMAPTPTMTAEAWVCRQFLGQVDSTQAATEAAAYLLDHKSDKGPTNFYYWYYATLALYQHGGEPWERWNLRGRDAIIALQQTAGHRAGSWDPDQSEYGDKGGRIYCTALATLTLEVYYRYQRLEKDVQPIERDPPLEPAANR